MNKSESEISTKFLIGVDVRQFFTGRSEVNFLYPRPCNMRYIQDLSAYFTYFPAYSQGKGIYDSKYHFKPKKVRFSGPKTMAAKILHKV